MALQIFFFFFCCLLLTDRHFRTLLESKDIAYSFAFEDRNALAQLHTSRKQHYYCGRNGSQFNNKKDIISKRH